MSRNALKLCPFCLEKLRKASARGGRSGSHADKVRAAMASVRRRREKAVTLQFDGMTLMVGDWAKRIGVSKKTIYRRMKLKLPVNQILMPHGAEHLPIH